MPRTTYAQRVSGLAVMSVADQLIASTAGDFRLRLMLLAAIALPSVLTGAALHKLASGSRSTWYNSCYLVYGLLFRVPGLGVVRADTGSGPALVLNIVFLVGTFIFAILLGVFADEVKARFKVARERERPLSMSGHVLLLNWNDQAAAIMQQVAAAQQQPGSLFYGCPLVVMSDTPRAELRSTVVWALRDFRDVDVHVRSGKPHKEVDLLRCCAPGAASILMLLPQPATSPQAGVALQVRSLVCLAALEDTGARPAVRLSAQHVSGPSPPLCVRQHVVVQAPSNRHASASSPVAALGRSLALRGSRMHILELADGGAVDRLIARTALQPHVASVLGQLISHRQGNVHFKWVEWTEQLAGMLDEGASAPGGWEKRLSRLPLLRTLSAQLNKSRQRRKSVAPPTPSLPPSPRAKQQPWMSSPFGALPPSPLASQAPPDTPFAPTLKTSSSSAGDTFPLVGEDSPPDTAQCPAFTPSREEQDAAKAQAWRWGPTRSEPGNEGDVCGRSSISGAASRLQQTSGWDSARTSLAGGFAEPPAFANTPVAATPAGVRAERSSWLQSLGSRPLGGSLFSKAQRPDTPGPTRRRLNSMGPLVAPSVGDGAVAYKSVRRLWDHALVVGLLSVSQDRLLLNPPDDTRVHPGDTVLLIAPQGAALPSAQSGFAFQLAAARAARLVRITTGLRPHVSAEQADALGKVGGGHAAPPAASTACQSGAQPPNVQPSPFGAPAAAAAAAAVAAPTTHRCPAADSLPSAGMAGMGSGSRSFGSLSAAECSVAAATSSAFATACASAVAAAIASGQAAEAPCAHVPTPSAAEPPSGTAATARPPAAMTLDSSEPSGAAATAGGIGVSGVLECPQSPRSPVEAAHKHVLVVGSNPERLRDLIEGFRQFAPRHSHVTLATPATQSALAALAAFLPPQPSPLPASNGGGFSERVSRNNSQLGPSGCQPLSLQPESAEDAGVPWVPRLPLRRNTSVIGTDCASVSGDLPRGPPASIGTRIGRGAGDGSGGHEDAPRGRALGRQSCGGGDVDLPDAGSGVTFTACAEPAADFTPWDVLRRYPHLLGAHALVLLRDSNALPQEADALVLTTLLQLHEHLSDLSDSRGGTEVQGTAPVGAATGRTCAPPLHVVCTMHSTEARHSARQHVQGLLRSAAEASAVIEARRGPQAALLPLFTCELLVPEEYTSGMMTLVAQDPRYLQLVHGIVNDTSAEIRVVPPTMLDIRRGEVLTFAELQEVARMRGWTALGLVHGRGFGPSGGRGDNDGLVLAPPAQQQVQLGEGDLVVVLRGVSD